MRIFIGLILGAAALVAADLNVKRVVLFKHGVGFFERQGELGPGESARLDFKSDEMNDVLKSLTVNVQGNGTISGLRYDSAIPTQNKLAELPFPTGDRQPLSSLLDHLRGSQLELRFGAQTVVGTIVSARQTVTKESGEREVVTVLTNDGDIRTLDLSAASSVRFLDAKLQLQFKDYLATLLQSRSRERRSVYIDSTDSGRRNILASYMSPMPVWKSSYRLVFPATGDPTLEGWAIVDNTTEEDWTGIRLALVSGRPISFISRLYEPKYIQRQVAELADEGAARPEVHAGVVGGVPGGIAAGVGGFMPPQPKKAMAPPPPAAMAREMVALDAASQRREFEPSNLNVSTEGREAGELFEYAFSQPVTVKRGQSAMLPFLQQKVSARKLLIYSDESSVHPRSAAEITNNTGKTLDGGPLTIYDANTYAGEALMETTKATDKRLISYAVDLGTRITTAFDSSAQTVREIKASRGFLTTRAAVRETKTFTIKNVDAKAKTLIIEHPVRYEYKLIGMTPTEKTPTAYRFQVALPAAADTKFAIEEERLLQETHSITNLTPDFLGQFVSNRSLSAAARQQLQTVLDKKRELAETRRSEQDSGKQIEELFRDQQRIRENLAALNRVTGQQEQVQRYSRELADQEAKLTALRDQQAQLRKRAAALESEIAALIEKMEF
ncbi:MAG TPA: DUF4139 domain-containing protein [Bryobacteraceae bacterium]|jgi:hypothetical protein|nr:DUF4139 domain-containing protein [Bryobacteraceae bacterium]